MILDVTSRDRHAAFELIGEFSKVIPVNPMDRNESLCLLKTRLRIGMQMEEEALQLLETLDYIPLTITQACAYIRENAPLMTISKYLTEFLKE